MGDSVILYKILPIRMGIGDPSSDNIRPILPGLSLLRDDGTTLYVYGGTLDATNLTLSVNRRLITLTGSNSESWSAVYSGSIKYFVHQITTSTRSYLDGCICSHFVSENISHTNTIVGIRQYYSNNQRRNRVDLRPENVSTMSVDNFKAYLREQYQLGTPVSILVTLVTPTTYQLTANELNRALISLGVSSSLAESRRRIVLNSQNNITETGSSYYKNNLSLTFIDLPGGVKDISNSTFQGCSNLVKVIMPDGVTRIGDRAFQDCSSLTSINSTDEVINIPSNVTYIGVSAFQGCSNLTSVDLPNTVRSLGNSAFSGCSNLESINLPNTITSIGMSAFYKCRKLTSIDLPNTLTSIANNCFYGTGLTSLVVPSGVTSIGTYGVFDCKNLLSVDLPDTLTSMAKGAFQFCTKLMSITCRAVVPPTEDGSAFFQVPATANIYVPAESVEAYKTASHWKSRADYIQAIPE